MRLHARLVGTTAVTALMAGGLLVVGAPPVQAASPPEVVAEGLRNPFKLSFGPDGDLYVAEAGVGGDTCFAAPAPGGGTAEVCFGASGGVTRVTDGDGEQERILDDLPSWVSPSDAVGPSDVAVAADGTMFIAVGLGGNVHTREDQFGADGERFGTVVEVAPDGDVSVLADLAAYEADVDPDQDQPGAEQVGEGGDSNPYGLALDDDGSLLVVDAGGNSMVRVGQDGQVALESTFPVAETEAPPFLGLPPGTMIPYQFVPTAVELDDDATLVSQLTGFPFPVGGAAVYDVAGDDLGVVADGFTNVVDIATDEAGNLFVAELSQTGLPPSNPRISQVLEDGSRKVLLNAAELGGLPTGLAVGPDGMVYVALGLTGEGTVVRVDPAVASDPAAAAACPPAEVPGSDFDDIGSSVHRAAIECLAWWGAARGTAAGTFSPQRAATRGQLASLLAKALEEGGVALPTDPPDAFDDDDGSPHEVSIDQLAALGAVSGFADGTFRPSAPISRGQLAKVVVATHDGLFDDLPTEPDAFTDDEGTTHEDSINAAAAAGWVQGTGMTTYHPGGTATRAQTASVLTRMLATLVESDDATPPAGAAG
jgi:hypothetical protein